MTKIGILSPFNFSFSDEFLIFCFSQDVGVLFDMQGVRAADLPSQPYILVFLLFGKFKAEFITIRNPCSSLLRIHECMND